MSSVEENCLDPDSPCSLSPSVISSLASSLAATHTVLVTVAPDSHNSVSLFLSSTARTSRSRIAAYTSMQLQIHLTAGAEVGIAIGAVFLVISLGSLVSVLRRRRRRGRHVSGAYLALSCICVRVLSSSRRTYPTVINAVGQRSTWAIRRRRSWRRPGTRTSLDCQARASPRS